jgi:hypothetical protein
MVCAEFALLAVCDIDESFEFWRSMARRVSTAKLFSAPGRASELPRGLEKLKDGRGKSEATEYSDKADGERDTDGVSGLKGARIFLDGPTSSDPDGLPLSSSALSMTDLILAILRADRGCTGDRGGARLLSCLLEDSLVMVRGCDDWIESILLVRLGKAGEASSFFTFLESNGSGDEERGTFMPK